MCKIAIFREVLCAATRKKFQNQVSHSIHPANLVFPYFCRKWK